MLAKPTSFSWPNNSSSFSRSLCAIPAVSRLLLVLLFLGVLMGVLLARFARPMRLTIERPFGTFFAMMNGPSNHYEVLQRLRGERGYRAIHAYLVACKCSISLSGVQNWAKKHDRSGGIPQPYWRALAAMARKDGHKDITYEVLEQLSPKRAQMAPKEAQIAA